MLAIKSRFGRRALNLICIALGVLAIPCTASSQTYPSKPIRLIVPYTPGGSNDLIARLIAQGITSAWNVAAIVENKPGGSANIGADFVAKSPPDGHTLLITSSSIMTINPYLIKSTPFDPIKDFEPITLLGGQPFVLVARPSLKFTSVQDLIAYAKKNPDKLSYASAGAGSGHHMAAELLKSLADIKMAHIPYKGTAPAIGDLLGGSVDVMFGPINQLAPLVKTERLTALAVVGTERTPLLPSLPTMSEAGVSGFVNQVAWLALAAPAKTPRDIIVRLNTTVRAILATPEVQSELLKQGIDAQTSRPEEVNALAVKDAARWSKLIKEAHIIAD